MGGSWSSTGSQEGCNFDRSTQNAVVQELREELDHRGLSDTLIASSDETWYDVATDTWKAFDDAAKRVVDRVNVHGYQGTGGRRDLLYSEVAGKTLWNSEYGDGDGSGLSMATNLHLDMHWLHNTAYCYWQAADESGGWGLFHFDSSNFALEAINPKYWVLAQYTRHIRPGMLILDSGGDDNSVVAYDAGARKLVIVGINTGSSASTVTYDLSRFEQASGPVTRWSTNTADGGERYVKHTDVSPIGSGKLVVQLISKTVQTFEIENVMLPSTITV